MFIIQIIRGKFISNISNQISMYFSLKTIVNNSFHFFLGTKHINIIDKQMQLERTLYISLP